MPLTIDSGQPRSHAEEVALFRHAIIGDLLVSELTPGALNATLKERASKRYRPPGASASRSYHWKTLQRWLLSARKGLTDLQPASRKRGHALALDEQAVALLLEMRREHPTAAADMLLDAAVQQGVVADKAISLATLRRLYARHDLSRRGAVSRAERAKDRRKWQTDRVCRLWHTDVCHVWRRLPNGDVTKAYVHAILDDHSRFVVALKACEAETENDLLALLVETLLRFPKPEVFYTDNGSTYRGDLLAKALDTVDIRLLRASPYDPQARGKMERFWRTLRQRFLDHDNQPHTLHSLNAALGAWLDVDYHRRPHGGLMGDAPATRFRAGRQTLPAPMTLESLAHALVVKRTAKVRNDATLSVNRVLYEVQGRHHCGTTVTVHIDPFTGDVICVLADDTPLRFNVCDASRNADRRRGDVSATTTPSTGADRFQRTARLLASAREKTHAT